MGPAWVAQGAEAARDLREDLACARRRRGLQLQPRAARSTGAFMATSFRWDFENWRDKTDLLAAFLAAQPEFEGMERGFHADPVAAEPLSCIEM